MAYISKGDVKKVRQNIRSMFPAADGWKWSVKVMDDHVGVTVALLEYPLQYKFPDSLVLDHHNPDHSCDENDITGWAKQAMIVAGEILMENWWSVSNDDSNFAFYPLLRIGTWEQSAINSRVSEPEYENKQVTHR